jgi:hypothetical protein
MAGELLENMNKLVKEMNFPTCLKQECHDRLVVMTKPLLSAVKERQTYIITGIEIVIDPQYETVSFSFWGKEFFPAYTVSQKDPGPVDIGPMALSRHNSYLLDIQMAINNILLALKEEA